MEQSELMPNSQNARSGPRFTSSDVETLSDARSSSERSRRLLTSRKIILIVVSSPEFFSPKKKKNSLLYSLGKKSENRVVPERVKNNKNSVFDGCDSPTIRVLENSYVERRVKKIGFHVQPPV